jgi:predicted small secreted protein
MKCPRRSVLIDRNKKELEKYRATQTSASSFKEVALHKFMRIAFTLGLLAMAAPILSACHTTAGFGQDLSQGGHALTNSADANAPSSPHP